MFISESKYFLKIKNEDKKINLINSSWKISKPELRISSSILKMIPITLTTNHFFSIPLLSAKNLKFSLLLEFKHLFLLTGKPPTFKNKITSKSLKISSNNSSKRTPKVQNGK
jgi:hypothetical protein